MDIYVGYVCCDHLLLIASMDAIIDAIDASIHTIIALMPLALTHTSIISVAYNYLALLGLPMRP